MRKMDMKKLLVFFVAIASVLLFVTTVSASIDFTNSVSELVINGVKVIDNGTSTGNVPALIAGETITAKVVFTPQGTDPNTTETASNIRVKAEIEGEKKDSEAITDYFDVEENNTYVKTLRVKVPSDLKDKSDETKLNIKIWGGDTIPYTKSPSFTLKIQRPSYNAEITITADETIKAGETLPVDVVVKNVGYNDLNDLSARVTIEELGIEKTAFLGDVVVEENNDDEDTVKERVYLKIPYDVEEGKYVLKVEVSNDDFYAKKTKEIAIENKFPETIVKTGKGLLFINPTNDLEIYKVILPSGKESIISVQSDSTNTFEVTPTSQEYVVNVLDMNGNLVKSFTFAQSKEEVIKTPIVTITIILGVIFLVLLVILIVLVTKKPEKAEELGESYY